MIVVTGTFRSGTSMWMQILIAAGFPYVGEKFPRDWAELLAAANPDGFYESELVAGIYYRTNPHPVSGAFLAPEDTRSHAVKVFIPGLIRSDLAYLDRVVATMREWRQYSRSVQRLHRIASRETKRDAKQPVALPAWLQWWTDNFSLIRDLATRRYPVHVTSYGRLLDDPEREIGEVLGWIGEGDLAEALRIVNPERQTQHEDAPTPDGVDPAHAEVFDELYAHIHEARGLSPSFIQKLNDTDQVLRGQLLEYQAHARAEAARTLLEAPS